jgi:hypothetical protein
MSLDSFRLAGCSLRVCTELVYVCMEISVCVYVRVCVCVVECA